MLGMVQTRERRVFRRPTRVCTVGMVFMSTIEQDLAPLVAVPPMSCFFKKPQEEDCSKRTPSRFSHLGGPWELMATPGRCG